MGRGFTLEDGYSKKELHTRVNLSVCYAFGRSKTINDCSCKKIRLSGGGGALDEALLKSMPKIDCKQCYLTASSMQRLLSCFWRHMNLFSFSPLRWYSPFICGNVSLVCISESFHCFTQLKTRYVL